MTFKKRDESATTRFIYLLAYIMGSHVAYKIKFGCKVLHRVDISEHHER